MCTSYSHSTGSLVVEYSPFGHYCTTSRWPQQWLDLPKPAQNEFTHIPYGAALQWPGGIEHCSVAEWY